MSTSTHGVQNMLSETQTSKALGITKKQWAAWRCQGKGPKYSKVGRNVFTRPEWVEAFIDGQVRQSTSEVISG